MKQKNKNTIVSTTPKHIQVADIVREQILNSDFAPGTRLCSDEELAVKYHVHRHTVAEGLKILAEEGLLERAPRRGSIVTGIHKEPVYLLMACPGFLDENNNSAVFVRRLYKNLHLQLMDKGVSVITVPMSPTNNPDDISEKYFDIIPHGAKVICVGEWGLQGLNCLGKKKCNVVFYDFQNKNISDLVEYRWKKIHFDRTYGAYNAIAELAKKAYKSPLLVFVKNKRYTDAPVSIEKALEALAGYYPASTEQNILWCERDEFEDFAANFNDITREIDFDSIYFQDVELARIILENIEEPFSKGVISNDITEIISVPKLCHYSIDTEELAKITIELFTQPDGTEKTIRPKLYNAWEILKNEK